MVSKFSRKQRAVIGILYSLSTAIITAIILDVFNLGGNSIVIVYVGVTALVTFVVPPHRFFGKYHQNKE